MTPQVKAIVLALKDILNAADNGQPYTLADLQGDAFKEAFDAASALESGEGQATEAEIQRAREIYCYGSSDNIEIDDNALVSRGDEGCFVQAWVWLQNEDSDAERRCHMHEWDHHEEIRREYKSKRFEIVDNELVGNISYYLVYRHSFPAGLRFHYMSDNPDFSCAYDDLAEVGEPFKPWFIAAMNRYNDKKQ